MLASKKAAVVDEEWEEDGDLKKQKLSNLQE